MAFQLSEMDAICVAQHQILYFIYNILSYIYLLPKTKQNNDRLEPEKN